MFGQGAKEMGLVGIDEMVGRAVDYAVDKQRRIMITDDNLDNWFTYHSPTQEQLPKFQAIRDAGKALATTIRDNSPASADQTAAIRLVRDACMTANAAIACGGK